MNDVSNNTLPLFELGLPGEIRDQLVGAALSGQKTATSSLLSEWTTANRPLPKPGEKQRLINSDREPVAVIELTKVEVCKLGEVDDAIAQAEGEGFRNATEWREAHERFWLGDFYKPHHPHWQMSNDTYVVIEYFKLITK